MEQYEITDFLDIVLENIDAVDLSLNLKDYKFELIDSKVDENTIYIWKVTNKKSKENAQINILPVMNSYLSKACSLENVLIYIAHKIKYMNKDLDDWSEDALSKKIESVQALARIAGAEDPFLNEEAVVKENIFDMGLYFYLDAFYLDNTVYTQDLRFSNMTEKQLYLAAIKNMKSMYPAKSKKIYLDELSTYAVSIQSRGDESVSKAIAMLYPECLRNVAKSEKSNLYVIPMNSDIVYLIKETDIGKKDVVKMEKYLANNNKNIEFFQVLSQHVLYYDMKKNRLKIVKNGTIDETEGEYVIRSVENEKI